MSRKLPPGVYFDEHRQQFHGQIMLPTGKRTSVYGKTAREVSRKLNAVRREIEAGLHGSLDSTKSLRAFIDDWLTNRKASLRLGTFISYTRLIENHLGDLADRPINTIRAKDLHDLYTAELKKGFSPATVRRLHVLLHDVLKTAMRLDLIPRNVATFVDPPSVPHTEFVPLTEYEVQRFLFEAREDRLGVVYLLALATGMRAGEYLGLQWSNVSLARRQVRVRTTLHRYKGQFVLEETKSRTSRRDIPLPESVCLALAAHQMQQEMERDLAGAAWDASWNIVFCSPIGTPLHGDMIYRHFKGLLKAARLSTSTRVHDLRHTFATLLLERGVNIRAVSELLGHASVTITLNTYGHVTPKMQDTALEHITQIVALPEPSSADDTTNGED